METARQNRTKQQGQGEKREVSKGPREQRRVKHAGQVAEQSVGTVTPLNPQEPGSTKDEAGGGGRGIQAWGPQRGAALRMDAGGEFRGVAEKGCYIGATPTILLLEHSVILRTAGFPMENKHFPTKKRKQLMQ